jgi:hypothetical protein
MNSIVRQVKRQTLKKAALSDTRESARTLVDNGLTVLARDSVRSKGTHYKAVISGFTKTV